MIDTWLYIGIFFLVAPLIPAVAILVPKLVAPRKPNPIKLDTYECGLETVGDSQVQRQVLPACHSFSDFRYRSSISISVGSSLQSVGFVYGG